MLLDRIDIDNHGPLNRVELGPFCEGLNVVFTPEGSGKTAIARFVRDSLVRREYPLGMMSSSAGRVVWADRNGKIHCRREQDGTNTGRRTVEFESRGDHMHRFDWLHGSWIEGIADSTDASRALESMRIPETIVDGLITDTAVTSVSRVIHAALASGLSDPALFAGLPVTDSSVSGLSPAENAATQASRRAMRDELGRVEAELASLSAVGVSAVAPIQSQASVAQRRMELEQRLAHLQSQRTSVAAPVMPMRHASQAELDQLHDRLWRLRVRQNELARWLDSLRAERNRARYTSPITASPYASSTGLVAPTPSRTTRAHHELNAPLRHQVNEIDNQITRWRRVIAEIDGLKQAIVADENRKTLEGWVSASQTLPLSDSFLRRERMQHHLAAVDYLAMHPDWNTDAPLHRRFEDRLLGRMPIAQNGGWASNITERWPDEIDLRVEAVLGHIDWLDRAYRGSHSVAWYQGVPASTFYRGASTLPEALGSIRTDLHNARRYGFTMGAARREQNWFDLEQCRCWIVASIDRLISHRDSVIRDRHLAEMLYYPRFYEPATARQHYSPWYVDHVEAEFSARSRELESVERELDDCLRRTSDVRRQMMTLPVVDSYATNAATIDAEINAVMAELQSLAAYTPAVPENSRVDWLQRRRIELVDQLGVPETPRSNTPLADEASQWLVRLTAGRLRRVDWNPADFTVAGATSNGQAVATIDGHLENQRSAMDRAYAALAVRMAAADLLARTGRAIPLVVETHRELLRPSAETAWHQPGMPAANPVPAEVNLAVIAALDDFTKNGRQVILLASDGIFAEQVARRGGRIFHIAGERVSHRHRPLWQPHFNNEAYVGPHGHTMRHDPTLAPSAVTPTEFPNPVMGDPLQRTDAYINRYDDEYFGDLPVGASFADINRNLDTIWQEAYGISPHGMQPMDPSLAYGAAYRPQEMPAMYPNADLGVNRGSAMPPQSPQSTMQTNWHDGYYFADRYTTEPGQPPRQPPTGYDATPSQVPPQRGYDQAIGFGETPARKASAFFLTVDSPIDQAPSVDAVAAARLRRLEVTHINHLMSQDPNRLADALGLAAVNAATIRRWQSECRLVCHVPQLRGFDARVLVGCGISNAQELAATDPNRLLDRVEAFLATERGQRILLSGTSYELSRITRWIAAANVHTDEPAERVSGTIDGRVLRRQRGHQAIDSDLDQDRYDYEFVDDHGEVVRARSTRRRDSQSRMRRVSRGTRQRSRDISSSRSNESTSAQSDSESGERSNRTSGSRTGGSRTSVSGTNGSNGRTGGSGSNRRRRSSTGTSTRSRSRSGSSSNGTSRSGYSRSETSRSVGTHGDSNGYQSNGSESESERAARSYESRESRSESSSSSGRDEGHGGEVKQWRFYLERESPVVDAPSIGSRMAERLEAVGVYTVNDLLISDPASLAEQLDYRRIDADVILAWQQQASLVCRVPMLRGHDAQLLVAAGIVTPEEVSTYDPHALLALIEPVASSSEGQRILRGGKHPDFEEITEWIEYASHHRELASA